MRIGICGGGRSREHHPGSREAIERGCTCCPVQNSHGEGERKKFGSRLFHSDDECPLHGFEATFGMPSAASSPGTTKAPRQCVTAKIIKLDNRHWCSSGQEQDARRDGERREH
jgi:hypothetical protein